MDSPKIVVNGIELRPNFFPFRCPVCNGFGTVKHGEFTCGSCKGKGYVEIKQDVWRETDFLEMAKELSNANFFIAGQGHFNINENELAEIFKALCEKDYKLLSQIYKRLQKKYMGE